MHLADAFIHSGYTFVYHYVCFLWIEPTTICTANTTLYHWATGTEWFQKDHVNTEYLETVILNYNNISQH